MELKPGDPLNDRELAEQMGISRTPMREALIMLNIAHMAVSYTHLDVYKRQSMQRSNTIDRTSWSKVWAAHLLSGMVFDPKAQK